MELLNRQSAPELDKKPKPANNVPTPEFHENPNLPIHDSTPDFDKKPNPSGRASTREFHESLKPSSHDSVPELDKEPELLKHPFAPVFDGNSEILILGSFPSVKSRGDGFFYAHPRNRFWKIMEYILEKRMSEKRFPDTPAKIHTDDSFAESTGILPDDRFSATLSRERFSTTPAGIPPDDRFSANLSRECFSAAPAGTLSRECFSADTAKILTDEPRAGQRIRSSIISATEEAHSETPFRTREGKILLLRELRFALWDVCAACSLEGSADSSIKSVVPNDLSPIFSTAKLKGVITNGKTADTLYRRYILEKTGVEPLCLPSTSPANAAWSDEKLRAAWYEGVKRLTGQTS